jgi:hypothetical protein
LSSGDILRRKPISEGRDAVAQAPVSGGAGGGVDAALVAAAERELAAYLGPVARLLVKRTAGDAHSAADFCRALAQELQDPGQREAFLRTMKQV